MIIKFTFEQETEDMNVPEGICKPKGNHDNPVNS